MNNISGDNEIYSGLGLVQQQQQEPQNQLNLDDFLELMITELTHQDPFKPMDNTELATQMSQFATVSGIGDLNQEVSSLASSLTSDQGLQAANLVGQLQRQRLGGLCGSIRRSIRQHRLRCILRWRWLHRSSSSASVKRQQPIHWQRQ